MRRSGAASWCERCVPKPKSRNPTALGTTQAGQGKGDDEDNRDRDSKMSDEDDGDGDGEEERRGQGIDQKWQNLQPCSQ